MPKRPHWSAERPAFQNARDILPGVVRRFFGAARKAAQSESPRNLHRLRLEAKRLRYTLELFESLYGPGLQRRLAQLRKLQGYLGDISDIGATTAMFENGADRRRIEVVRLQDYLRNRLADRLAAFRRYWKTVMDAPGERERWMTYVARFARPERSSTTSRHNSKSA